MCVWGAGVVCPRVSVCPFLYCTADEANLEANLVLLDAIDAHGYEAEEITFAEELGDGLIDPDGLFPQASRPTVNRCRRRARHAPERQLDLSPRKRVTVEEGFGGRWLEMCFFISTDEFLR